MNINEKKINSRASNVYRKLEDVVGCKWSVSVLLAIDSGVSRPGALERHIAGISTKVLSERLRKLTTYGLLEKQSFPEVPPRTEYSLTPSGRKLISIIQQIHTLDSTLHGPKPRSFKGS
jgi:DNA-binding HxlR family transcriptional regulator